MTRWKSTLVAVALLSLVGAGAASAGWIHFTNAVIQAEQDIQKHPAKLTQMMIVPTASEAPLACAGYSNNLAKNSKGKVTTQVLIERADGTTETKKLVGRVKQGFVISCKALDGDLSAGDLVFFEHSLRGFARLRREGKRANFAEIASIISTAGVPGLTQNAPLGFGPAKGTSPLNLLPLPGPGWYHSSRSLFQADKNGQKHPEEIARTVFIPGERANARICLGYNNISGQKKQGRVVGRALLTRANGDLETLNFIGPVKDNQFLKCQELPKKLQAGAFIEFFVEFKGMGKLGTSGGTVDFADVVGLVSTSGDPVFRQPPGGTPDPPSPGRTPPPPPPGGGGISQADERAVSKLLLNSKPTQLWRSKNDSPEKWTVVGPKTRAVPGTNQLIASTAGFGATPAAALADYERKQGSLGPEGSLLSAADRADIVWYSNINSSGGPTSVRRDAGGKYHGELFRPSLGAQTSGSLPTMGAAFDWLRSKLGG